MITLKLTAAELLTIEHALSVLDKQVVATFINNGDSVKIRKEIADVVRAIIKAKEAL